MNDGSKEDNRGVGNLEWRRRGSKVWKRGKKLVSQRFHKYIYVFWKKVSKRMPTKKMWDHTIELKEQFC